LEPFFTTKGERGTGLGLAVVYGIVQRHEGTIDIVSEKGRGTTFEVTFPTTTTVAMPIEEKIENTQAPLRVLVADDQEIICELLAEYLRGDGHDVVLALDGTAALETFLAGDFDLVVTDQSMPGMSGVQLAEAVKQKRPVTPVMLLTGFGDEMQASGDQPGAIDLVVSKPVSHADLRKALASVVAKKASAKEAA
jgi:CheY-like chemotaxis protein